MWPISFDGRIVLKPATPKMNTMMVRRTLAESMYRERAKSVRETTNGLILRGGYFRAVTNANPLVGVTSMSIEIEQRSDCITVHYVASRTQSLVLGIILFVVCMAALVLSFAAKVGEGITIMIIFVSTAVLFANVGNYLISKHRIRRMLINSMSGLGSASQWRG